MSPIRGSINYGMMYLEIGSTNHEKKKSVLHSLKKLKEDVWVSLKLTKWAYEEVENG